jgi:hypothetical protein
MNTRIEQIAAAAQQITASATSMQHNVGEVAEEGVIRSKSGS